MGSPLGVCVAMDSRTRSVLAITADDHSVRTVPNGATLRDSGRGYCSGQTHPDGPFGTEFAPPAQIAPEASPSGLGTLPISSAGACRRGTRGRETNHECSTEDRSISGTRCDGPADEPDRNLSGATGSRAPLYVHDRPGACGGGFRSLGGRIAEHQCTSFSDPATQFYSMTRVHEQSGDADGRCVRFISSSAATRHALQRGHPATFSTSHRSANTRPRPERIPYSTTD